MNEASNRPRKPGIRKPKPPAPADRVDPTMPSLEEDADELREGAEPRTSSARSEEEHGALVPDEDTADQTDIAEAEAHELDALRPNLDDATIEMQWPAPRNSIKHYFDQLKINFLARYAHTVKSVLFVATSRGHGTSTSAFNFAASLAQDPDLRVLFINADLRAPADPTHRISESTSLAQWDAQAAVRAHQENLHIMPSGRGYVDPTVLFQSKRFESLMAEIVQRYDYVVVDGPALDEAPESIALTNKVDGVILIVDAQHTRRKIAVHAKRRIEDVGGKLLGVVLNRRTFYIPNWLYRRV